MKPTIVGIAGGSAGGKSTFCSALEKTLTSFSVHVIHTDDYFRPEAERPKAKAPVTGRIYMDDNHPDTLNLPGLHEDIRKAIEEGQTEILIIEGLLTLWDEEIVPLLDLKIFVDCRPDERIVRRLRRNMEWGLSFDQVADVYLDLVRYRHDEYVEPTKWRADLILNGSKLSEQALSMVSSYIQQNCKQKGTVR